MKSKIFKKLKKHWITIWLAVAVSALAVIVGYAAYTRVSTTKRVVSTQAGADVLFSSNYMMLARKTTNEVANPQQYTSDNPMYTMNVCNFAQGDRRTWFNRTINYTLTAQLVDKSKNAVSASGKTFTIKKKGVSGSATDLSDGVVHTVGSFQLKYSKDDIAYDEFEITLDKSELQSNSPNYYVLIIATPDSTEGGAIPTNISGYIGVSQGNTSTVRWTGEIEDQGLGTNTYHGYNFVLHGSGKGIIKFGWDPRYLSISEISVSTNSLPSPTTETVQIDENTSATFNTIELSVDSSVKARYEINFFKETGSDYGSSIDNYLKFISFTETTSAVP